MTKLFVGNLPYSATEADLTNFFSQAGVTVDSVNVMRDRFTGEARGFGFVEIGNDAQAAHAVEACNGRDLMGRAVVVNEARPMTPREGGGAGGGGRPGGGGGGGGRREGGGGGGKGRGGERNRW
ncbi:MAG: RNA recognition motif domain-containing protein [Bryobacteraceae bacterium]